MFALEVTPITSSILKESLTYFSKDPVETGSIVSIPLRKKEIKGIVLSQTPVQNIKQNLRHQNFKIKNITSVDECSIFSPAYLKTIQKFKNYYLVNTGKLIDISYPKSILKNISSFKAKAKNKKLTAKEDFSYLEDDYETRIIFYRKLIEQSKHNTLHIICPSIEHCKKVSSDLAMDNIILLTSKTSEKKLLDYLVKSTEEKIHIVSTPGFIDIASEQNKTLVIEKDSSPYYIRAVAPHVDYRDFIYEYAKNSGHKLYIADLLLRTIHADKFKTKRKEIFKKNLVTTLTEPKQQLKKITDKERIEELDSKQKKNLITPILIKKIEESIKNKKKIFCYVPKKGLAPIVSCMRCGSLARDLETNTPYTLYEKKEFNSIKKIFINKKTGAHIPAFDVCQNCNSSNLAPYGIGTETIRQELQALFPDVEILISDQVHTKTQKQIKEVFGIFNEEKEKPIILIGTQKALPYIEEVDVSFVFSIESLLARMNYYMEFSIAYLLSEIESFTKSHVFIETKQENDLSLYFVKNNNYKEFRERNNEYAHLLQLPPYYTHIALHHFFQKKDYKKLYTLYMQNLGEWSPMIHVHPTHKADLLRLDVHIHLKKEDWNIDRQNMLISQKLPFEERAIHMEINPE